MKTFTLSLPRETVPGADTQRHWENTRVLPRQGENICAPELLEAIGFVGRGWGGGGRGAGSGAAGGVRREGCGGRVCEPGADGTCTLNWRGKPVGTDFYSRGGVPERRVGDSGMQSSSEKPAG